MLQFVLFSFLFFFFQNGCWFRNTMSFLWEVKKSSIQWGLKKTMIPIFLDSLFLFLELWNKDIRTLWGEFECNYPS